MEPGLEIRMVWENLALALALWSGTKKGLITKDHLPSGLTAVPNDDGVLVHVFNPLVFKDEQDLVRCVNNQVRGAVTIGDFIVASGHQDGTAMAVSPEAITPEQGRLIVGRAWEASEEEAVKLVKTIVGLPEAASTTMALARRVEAQQKEIEALTEQVAALNSLKAQIAQIESTLHHMATTTPAAQIEDVRSAREN